MRLPGVCVTFHRVRAYHFLVLAFAAASSLGARNLGAAHEAEHDLARNLTGL